LKKIIFTTILISVLSTFSYSVYAHPEGVFVVSGCSDTSYTFDSFTIGNTTTDMNSIAYTGFKLVDFLVTGTPRYNDIRTYGIFTWENPDYIIVEGEQSANLIYHDLLIDNKVVFNIKIFGKINNNDTYKLDNKINISNIPYYFNNNIIHDGRIGCDILDVFPKIDFRDIYGTDVLGDISFPDWDNTKEGIHDFTWVFTPKDSKYNPIRDTIKIRLLPRNEDELAGISLTATSLLLENNSTYDINLNNKVSGSKYRWTSSNPKIAKVNSKNGLVTAVSEGEVVVKCEITLPDGNNEILKSYVIVGYDENAPMLTETILDLEVGDKFDINIENKIAKSKYRWISNDRSIVKVNSSNGKITTMGVGRTHVTCVITTPDNQVIVLKCEINVVE